MGGGEVLKKGLLIKSPPLDSGALKMWRRRWFVLLSSKVLEYYKSDGGEQKGVINLEDCHSVNCNLSHKRYILTICGLYRGVFMYITRHTHF
jgi:hypothetical protein